MPIRSPQELRNETAGHTAKKLDAILERCNDTIRAAMQSGQTTVRICTGIAYGESGQWAIEAALENAGYRVDGEMTLRHGHIIDVEWDAE